MSRCPAKQGERERKKYSLVVFTLLAQESRKHIFALLGWPLFFRAGLHVSPPIPHCGNVCIWLRRCVGKREKGEDFEVIRSRRSQMACKRGEERRRRSPIIGVVLRFDCRYQRQSVALLFPFPLSASFYRKASPGDCFDLRYLPVKKSLFSFLIISTCIECGFKYVFALFRISQCKQWINPDRQGMLFIAAVKKCVASLDSEIRLPMKSMYCVGGCPGEELSELLCLYHAMEPVKHLLRSSGSTKGKDGACPHGSLLQLSFGEVVSDLRFICWVMSDIASTSH